MARLKLTNISEEIPSGHWLSGIAAKVAHGGLDAIAGDDARSFIQAGEFASFYSNSMVFDPSIQAADDQESRMNATEISSGQVYVQFHFDRTLPVDSNNPDSGTIRIVNVVVPDFTTKLKRDDVGDVILEDGEPQYDLTGVAEELFGYSVRKACE